MSLHRLLTDRIAVRVLKTLYDEEIAKKSSYTLKLEEISKKLGLEHIPDNSVANLDDNKLINLEMVEDQPILSISQKGKHFIEIFDQLVELFNAENLQPKNNVSIKYELTNLEKRILVLTLKIGKEIGPENVSLKLLTMEIFPHEVYEKKLSTVSRYVKKLEELKLVERRKEGRLSYVKLTEKAFRIIKEQFLMGLVH
jgi:CTP-dependent riboflavin kinase